MKKPAYQVAEELDVASLLIVTGSAVTVFVATWFPKFLGLGYSLMVVAWLLARAAYVQMLRSTR